MSRARASSAQVELRTQGSGTHFAANAPVNWDFLTGLDDEDTPANLDFLIGMDDEDMPDVRAVPEEGGEEPVRDATPTRAAEAPSDILPPHGVTHAEDAAEVELQGLPQATTEFDSRPHHVHIVHLLPEDPGLYSLWHALHNTANTSPEARARKSREDAACVDAYMNAHGLDRRLFNDEMLIFVHGWARETNWVYTEAT